MRKDTQDLVGGAKDEPSSRGPMYDLFLAKCPKHLKPWGETTILDIDKLADDVGVTRQNVYVWFNKDKLPPNRVESVLALEGTTLVVDDLLPFVLKS